MIVNLTTLASGLRVVTARLPGFDSAAVSAFINAGSRNEGRDENGIAHFLEHMAFKGTESRSALRIAAEIENYGSNINAYTSQNTTAYYVTGLGSEIERSVAIIGDVLTNSLFDPADIEIERGVILQEISRSLDDPNHVAYDHYGSVAYPGQALGRSILGPPDFIKRATRDNFVSFVDRHYTAGNMVVAGVGDFLHDDFVRMVEQHFAGLRVGAVGECYPADWGGGISQSTSDKFEQVTALIGWKSVAETDPRVYAHRMLATALGGSMSAPLFQEVREKRGLVYAVGASHDSGPDYGDLTVYAGTTPDKLDEVVRVSCEVFWKSITQIGDEDFLRARNKSLVGYATVRERPMAVAGYLGGNILNFGRIIEVEEKKQSIMRVTKQDLIDAAELVFRSPPSVALVGPVPDTDYLGLIKRELA